MNVDALIIDNSKDLPIVQQQECFYRSFSLSVSDIPDCFKVQFFMAVYFVDISLWWGLLNGSCWWLESKLKLTKLVFFNIILLQRASAERGLSVTPASYPTISIEKITLQRYI